MKRFRGYKNLSLVTASETHRKQHTHYCTLRKRRDRVAKQSRRMNRRKK